MDPPVRGEKQSHLEPILPGWLPSLQRDISNLERFWLSSPALERLKDLEHCLCVWGDGETSLLTEDSFSPSVVGVYSFPLPALPRLSEELLEGTEFLPVPNFNKLDIPWDVLEIFVLC